MALLSPTPTPFAPLELTVATAPRTDIQMAVDAAALRWDRVEVDLDQVTAISYAARPRRHWGVVRRVTRTIRLWTGDSAPFGIELRVDEFSALVLLIVTAASSIALLAGRASVDQAIEQQRQPLFYAAWLLALSGFCGILVTEDAFNIFVFIINVQKT